MDEKVKAILSEVEYLGAYRDAFCRVKDRLYQDVTGSRHTLSIQREVAEIYHKIMMEECLAIEDQYFPLPTK